MFRNNWFVGCSTAELKDKPLGTEILNEKIVLFRDGNGRSQALKDRCCHRGFPLSKGQVCEGNIACGYHGWQYDGAGQCVKIPSQTPDKQISKVYHVPNFSCEEKDGYIWVWLGDTEKKQIPAIPEFAEGKWIQGSRRVKCNFLRALEITFDGAHVYFAHPKHPATIAAQKFGLISDKSEVRMTELGCVVFSPPATSDEQPIPQGASTMAFNLPGHIRFVWPMPNGVYYMNFFVTPIGEEECRIDYLVQNFDPNGPHLRWSSGPSDIIEEDAFVLEAIQPAYMQEGEEFEKSVEADLPHLTLRRIVRMAMDNKWNGLKTDLPPRRTFTAMRPSQWN